MKKDPIEGCGLFSNLQFGFQEGVGCTEASFTILESINHMLERGNKVFGCFLDVRKAFDTVWVDGLLYKLFTEFGISARMWLPNNPIQAGGGTIPPTGFCLAVLKRFAVG